MASSMNRLSLCCRRSTIALSSPETIDSERNERYQSSIRSHKRTLSMEDDVSFDISYLLLRNLKPILLVLANPFSFATTKADIRSEFHA